MRRPGASALTERHVAAQHTEATLRELFGHGDKQRRCVICTRAMGEHKAGTVWFCQRRMQNALYAIAFDNFGH
jgi:hypothetical protein